MNNDTTVSVMDYIFDIRYVNNSKIPTVDYE